jgi:PD-(D/E)XK nuclease superfamily
MPPFASTLPSVRDCWNRFTMLSWRMNSAGEDSSDQKRRRTVLLIRGSGLHCCLPPGQRQQPIPVVSENVRIDTGFRADLIVDKVKVEIKSVEVLTSVHKKRLLPYLRLADKRLGLLLNFHVALSKDGITRIANGLEEEPHAKPQRRVESQHPRSRRFEVEDLAGRYPL